MARPCLENQRATVIAEAVEYIISSIHMISVVLATYNEAHNLKRSLDSVKQFADEIIVVDGQSPDGTAELAEKLGAKVFTTTNKANFHINKQMAIDHAKGELIFQLDADEVIDEELGAFIVKVDQDSTFQAEYAAWWINRKNYFFGQWLKKGGQYPDPVIRLFRRRQAKLPMQDVHEQMIVDGQTGTARGHLLHYSNPTFADYLRKFNTYTSFKAEQLLAAHVPLSIVNHWRYFCWLPIVTFCLLFIRHRGYVDGLAGFIFALMSGLHHTISYLKLWEKRTYGNNLN